jgi:lipoprotein-anchoring transpeptidase ErfK/SrfK
MDGSLRLSLVVLLCSMSPAMSLARPPAQPPVRPPAHAARKPPKPSIDPDLLRLQVMLDRAGFSVGEIDGSRGEKTDKAWQAYQQAQQPRGLSGSAATDGFTDHAPATVVYIVTAEDLAGPFVEQIPKDLDQQGRLEWLGYTSAWEMLGERFHCSPRLLHKLNPAPAGAGRELTEGTTLTVPNVIPMVPPDTKGKRKGPAPAEILAAQVMVSKAHHDAIALDANGTVIFYAPVSSGSQHDPLPIGDWTVRGVYVKPHFNFNPDLFWDAEPSQKRTRIAPGPNNPVGFVWIDLDRPHYGLHGTPEPAMVGITQSHGCVRLTNWDALRLAAMVVEGTRVSFRP